MRIVLIIEHFDATRGGAEAFTVWLAAQLADRGHEVHIICHDVSARINRYRAATQRASHDADRSHAGHGNDPQAHEGVTVHTLGGVKLSSGIGFRLFGTRARSLCKRLKPDLIHSISVAYPGDIYHSQAGVYANLQQQAVASRSTSSAARWKRVMLALSSKQRTLIMLERRATRPSKVHGPEYLISLSPMMTAELQGIYHVPAERIRELPNPRLGSRELPTHEVIAADRAWFRGLYCLGAQDRVAIFVGHDFRRKGLRFAIETIARTPDWRLVVVGLGKSREYVELAAALGLNTPTATRVIFTGPTREVERIYAGCDALLFPTFYDSFGLAAIEALAFGLPVISTEFLGASYIVKQHNAGTIVASPREVDAMASALTHLPQPSSPEFEHLAARARKASLGMTGDLFMDKLLVLYKQVARNK